MLFSFSSKHYAFNFDSPEDIMPLLRSEAPASIPDEETLEYLLGERASSATTHHRRKTKAYNELDDEAKARTGLVTLGERQEIIPGDPHGIYPCWAGNVGHQRDSRMVRLSSSSFSLHNIYGILTLVSSLLSNPSWHS